MTIAIFSNVALSALKPVAITVARQVGVAVGYGALAGTAYFSLRGSMKVADVVIEKFAPTPIERIADAETRARRSERHNSHLEADLVRLRSALTSRAAERDELVAKLDLAQTAAKTLAEQVKAMEAKPATPAPKAATVATPSRPRPRAVALKTAPAPKRAAAARSNGSARAA